MEAAKTDKARRYWQLMNQAAHAGVELANQERAFDALVRLVSVPESKLDGRLPYVLDGEVKHRQDCRECDGCGALSYCRWHSGNCPCARERECRRCDGLGYLVCDDCDCALCETLAETMADADEVERIRERTEAALIRFGRGDE